MENLFFNSWDSLLRTLTISVFAYVSLLAMLRVIGNRTLAQLNAFDFIVTVALGSTLATVLLNKNVSLADGVLALGLLIGLQYVTSTLSIHSKAFRRLIKTEPFLLFYKGKYDEAALRKHRITKDEVLQIIRSNGTANIDEVEAIIIETNGNFSILQKPGNGKNSSLKNVNRLSGKRTIPEND